MEEADMNRNSKKRKATVPVGTLLDAKKKADNLGTTLMHSRQQLETVRARLEALATELLDTRSYLAAILFQAPKRKATITRATLEAMDGKPFRVIKMIDEDGMHVALDLGPDDDVEADILAAESEGMTP